MPGKLYHTGTFRWLVALFCVLLGSFMFVTPHQFDGAAYVGLRPLLPDWGLVFLIAGFSLIATDVFAAPRAVDILAHLLSAAVLIVLTVGIAEVGAWLGATGYAFLAMGTLVAATIPRVPPGKPPAARDLLSLVVGASSIVSAGIVFGLPAQLSSPLFDPVRSWLPIYGAGYLIGGFIVVVDQIRPIGARLIPRTAHLVLGLSMWAFAAPFLPLHVWTGIAYAGLFGAAIIFLPWRDQRLRRLDPSSLRTRLAVTTGTVAGLSLIAIVALNSSQDERNALAESLDTQQAL